VMASALRADARRNLDRILEAASNAFAEIGPEVTIDEIARRAGVGHGTVFRRFPTKEALRAAVIGVRVDEMLSRARELLERPDAAEALREFVWVVADSCRRDRALFEGLDKCDCFPEVAADKQELHELADKLIRRARRAGAIRRDLGPRDIGALVGAAIQASTHAERPDAWKHYVEVVLDGLRPA
jgi:AcrR family transcriptional regulator